MAAGELASDAGPAPVDLLGAMTVVVVPPAFPLRVPLKVLLQRDRIWFRLRDTVD